MKTIIILMLLSFSIIPQTNNQRTNALHKSDSISVWNQIKNDSIVKPEPIEIKITEIPKTDSDNTWLIILITSGFTLLGTIIGWFLNDRTKWKELERKTISEKRLNWIESFRQESAELIHFIGKLGFNARQLNAINNKTIPIGFTEEQIVRDYWETIDKVSLLNHKVRLLLSEKDELNHETLKLMKKVIEVQASRIDLTTNQKEITDLYDKVANNLWKIIQKENDLFEIEIRGKK